MSNAWPSLRHGRFAFAKGLAQFVLKMFVSVGLVVFIVKSTNVKGIGGRLLEVNVEVILVAAAIMAALVILPALRWTRLIRLGGGTFDVGTAYRLTVIGNFFGQVLPSIGGDGVRAWYAYKLGIPLAISINSVLLDRLAALIAVLLLALLSLPWLWAMVPRQFAWWTISLIVFGTMGGAVLLNGVTRLPESWNRWRIIKVGKNLADSCHSLISNKPYLFQVIGLSLLVHLSVAVFVYALTKVVHVPASLEDCLLLIPLVMLVSTIPISVAGWGIREGAMVVAFGFLKIPPSDALLVSILFGIVVALASSPGLFFWVTMGRVLKTRTQHAT
jgi:uncharacterized protein (TIRG00374 family)